MNNKEKKLYKLYKAQNLALYWLLGIIVSGLIGLQLGEIQAIADFNYNLHEIMYFPFIISLYVAPVVLVIYIFLLVKYLVKRGKQKVNIKESIKSIFVICSIGILVSITVYQTSEVSTTGIFEIDEKLHEDGKYYFVVDDKKIRVTSNEFKLVEKNQQYLIRFVWNKRTPNKGQLEIIVPMKQ